MSVDMDSSEVDKIRREFEMYKIGKQNEMSDLIKKEKKLESENRRLRAELQVRSKLLSVTLFKNICPFLNMK